MANSFHRAIGSDSYYTSITIDQPGRYIAMSRFGTWAAGNHSFDDSEVVMSIGNHVVVSTFAIHGRIPAMNPYRRMNDGVKQGKKYIVIDPRETEVARKAHLHLQVRPGEDPTLLAGIIRVILAEQLFDHDFCERYVNGLDELRQSVDPYTLNYVSLRRVYLKSKSLRRQESLPLDPAGQRSQAPDPTRHRGQYLQNIVCSY